MTVRRALISVSNKEGIANFAQGLIDLTIEILSTGGTGKILEKAEIPYQEVATITGFPEMLEGRVKTLHPHIHAGILAKRDDPDHLKALSKHHITPIDIVVCNLYPFERTVQQPKVSIEDVIENIDIGGPTLVRAAAKNYKDVIIVTNPHQYKDILTKLQQKNDLSLAEREQLAVEAFSHTAQYDAIISTYLRRRWTDVIFPDNLSIPLRKKQDMRYGENPHQKGAFYETLPTTSEPCIANATQLQGKELSFNNMLDADCAFEAIKEFTAPTCVIVKHANPCGIASADTLLQAWKDAFATDVYSPYGGIVAFNRAVPQEVAEELSSYFLEVIIAPEFDTGALKLFEKKKNLRLLQNKGLAASIKRDGVSFRSVVGGTLIQDRDVFLKGKETWKVVTKNKPLKKDLESMEFAIRCVKHVKSNSVIFVKDTRTVGIGGGQTSRVDAAWIATHKGKENIKGSIVASDAFFPFRDAVDVAAQAGVKAIIQPGGSIRDDEVINAANEHGLAMVFTGQRYFRH